MRVHIEARAFCRLLISVAFISASWHKQGVFAGE